MPSEKVTPTQILYQKFPIFGIRCSRNLFVDACVACQCHNTLLIASLHPCEQSYFCFYTFSLEEGPDNVFCRENVNKRNNICSQECKEAIGTVLRHLHATHASTNKLREPKVPEHLHFEAKLNKIRSCSIRLSVLTKILLAMILVSK